MKVGQILFVVLLSVVLVHVRGSGYVCRSNNDCPGLGQVCLPVTAQDPGFWYQGSWIPSGQTRSYCVQKAIPNVYADQNACGWDGPVSPWMNTCAESNLGLQCPTGTSLCAPKWDNGTVLSSSPGLFSKTPCCLPSETCCNGVCCASNSKCVSSPFSSSAGWTNPSTGIPTSFSPSQCTTYIITAPAVFRAFILPIFLTLLVLGLCYLTFWPSVSQLERNLPNLALLVPVCLLLFCAIMQFFFYSTWPFAILLVLFAFSTFAVNHDSHRRKWVVMFFGLFVLAVYIGGLGVSTYIVSSGGVFPSLGSSDPRTSTQNVLVSSFLSPCAAYYNWFNTDPATLAWNADHMPAAQFTGLCALGWFSAIQFFCILSVLCLLTIITVLALSLSTGGGALVKPADVQNASCYTTLRDSPPT